jgi:hypothetical protein
MCALFLCPRNEAIVNLCRFPGGVKFKDQSNFLPNLLGELAFEEEVIN